MAEASGDTKPVGLSFAEWKKQKQKSNEQQRPVKQEAKPSNNREKPNGVEQSNRSNNRGTDNWNSRRNDFGRGPPFWGVGNGNFDAPFMESFRGANCDNDFFLPRQMPLQMQEIEYPMLRRGRNFNGPNFNGGGFDDGPNFDGPCFEGPNFNVPNFTGGPFNGPNFNGGPNLNGSNFNGGRFDGPNFNGGCFDGPNFNGNPFNDRPNFNGRPNFKGRPNFNDGPNFNKGQNGFHQPNRQRKPFNNSNFSDKPRRNQQQPPKEQQEKHAGQEKPLEEQQQKPADTKKASQKKRAPKKPFIPKPEMPKPLEVPIPKEERQQQWKEYREKMKPFRNRDFLNAKRTIQRLGKKDRSTLEEYELHRLQNAEAYMANHKAQSALRALGKELPLQYVKSEQPAVGVDGKAAVGGEVYMLQPKLEMNGSQTASQPVLHNAMSASFMAAQLRQNLAQNFVPGGVLYQATST